ncbi:MAG: archaemetzincin [Pirellulaceae bacterium]
MLFGSTTISGEFQPPDENRRRAAIGPTSALRPQLQRAFDPAHHFQPIPTPQPDDWLAHHTETGQTFLQFSTARRNIPDLNRGKIYLQPLGEFDDNSPSLDKLETFTEAFFGLPAEVLPRVQIHRAFATRVHRDTGRRQLLTRDLLSWLRGRLPRDGYLILGVTMTDLYPPDGGDYVFGQASFRDRVGVYSFARYDPRFFGQHPADDVETLVLLRSCKVLSHEACHMFNMRHCIYYNCLLNGGNHLGESDARPLHLCPVCLRKLHGSVGFHVERRYERLQEFSRDAGFDAEQQWLTNRLNHLGR